MEKSDFVSQVTDTVTSTVRINDVKEFLREYEVDRIGMEFRNRVITLAIASLGLITALAWDETLRALFHELFGTSLSIGEHALYALLVTTIAVVVSYGLAKLFRSENKSKIKSEKK